VLQRAAALLRAGMPSQQIWDRLGDESAASFELTSIADAVKLGMLVSDALAQQDAPEWRVIAATWAVAERSGAPLAGALDRIASALRSLEQLDARRQVLLAGPRSTVRLVIVLPPVVLLFGSILGFDTWTMLMSPLGMIGVCAGGALLGIAHWWSNTIISRVASQENAAGFALDLTSIHLQGGSSSARAVREVVDCVDAAGAAWISLADLAHDGVVQRTLAEADGLGSSRVRLLLAAADTARRTRAGELESETERLSTRILVPLGACVLPAFILMGALPVVLSMVQSVDFA